MKKHDLKNEKIKKKPEGDHTPSAYKENKKLKNEQIHIDKKTTYNNEESTDGNSYTK